jgi:hypothetical protein
MQDDVGADLFRALAAERSITVELVLKNGSIATRLQDEMRQMVQGLAALEQSGQRSWYETGTTERHFGSAAGLHNRLSTCLSK